MTDPTGTPPTPPPAYPAAPPAGTPAAPVPGKTLGIVALIVAFFFNVIGLVLGIVALVQSRKAGARNLPAVWAIIVGAVLMVIGIIVAIVIVIGLGAAADLYQQCLNLGGGTQQVNGVTVTCS
jgi:heme/copper-type cytochrome/quinol oxidase subunit 2